MTKLAIWIDACLRVMKDNVEIIEECYQKKQMDLMIEQSKVFKKHIDSFIDFLEKRKAEGL
jgi:hypothetical protein